MGALFRVGMWRRSYDLTPLDYLLWAYVKSLVYTDKPETINVLGGNIRYVIADIRPQVLQKVVENWISRLEFDRASRILFLIEYQISKKNILYID